VRKVGFNLVMAAIAATQTARTAPVVRRTGAAIVAAGLFLGCLA